LEEGRERLSWRMQQVLALIGKSSKCKVQLVGAGGRRFHGSLVRTPQSVGLVCFAGSTRGNGLAAPLERLQNGDLVQIGSYHMRFALEPAKNLSGSQMLRLPANEVALPAGPFFGLEGMADGASTRSQDVVGGPVTALAARQRVMAAASWDSGTPLSGSRPEQPEVDPCEPGFLRLADESRKMR